MNETSEDLVNIPALIYSVLWQTREMGFLKKILDSVNVKSLRILMFFTDYKPGCLVSFDGDKGDYSVQSIDDLEGVEYDGAIIGKLRPVIKSLEKHLIRRSLWNLLTGKVKLKKKGKLLKFAKILMRCAI